MGQNKVATLDLTKAYDKVNHKTLLGDYEGTLEREVSDMLLACLLELRIRERRTDGERKENKTGTKARSVIIADIIPAIHQ